MFILKRSTYPLLYLLCCLAPFYGQTLQASAQPYELDSSKALLEPFKLVGEGKMRWLWFDIYDVKLSTPSGKFKNNHWPLSLELTYSRAISREQLLKTTQEEWQRQKLSYQTSWLSELEAIWPNVSDKDKITLYVDQYGASHFFFNQQFVGSVFDEQFTQAFTAIWLSEHTIKPKLRNQLIGLSK